MYLDGAVKWALRLFRLEELTAGLYFILAFGGLRQHDQAEAEYLAEIVPISDRISLGIRTGVHTANTMSP